MTTIGTEQQPAPVDDPTKVGTEPAAPTSIEATPPAESPLPLSMDPDDVELRDAIAAAKTEEAAAPPAQGDGATPPTPAEPAPAPAPAPPPAASPPAMIPKARFDEGVNKERERADKATQDAAYWRGVAEARAAGTAPATAPGAPPPAPAAPTSEQRLTEIHTEIDALAKKFDDGEITMTDFKKQERVLTDRELAIREEVTLSKVPAAPSAPASKAGDDSLYLETLTVDLETKHPWVNVFETVGNEADWAYLTAQARSNLAERGIDPKDGTTISRYHLRQEVAALADAYGPGMLTARAQAKGVPLPGSAAPAPAASAAPAAVTPPAAAPKPGLSPEAAARAAKLATHAAAPPSVPALSGSPSAAEGEVSADRLDSMTDEEIGNLPLAVRNKLRGIT